jgi:predicted Fe-S protein YdhL (DUF1289 family)
MSTIVCRGCGADEDDFVFRRVESHHAEYPISVGEQRGKLVVLEDPTAEPFMQVIDDEERFSCLGCGRTARLIDELVKKVA